MKDDLDDQVFAWWNLRRRKNRDINILFRSHIGSHQAQHAFRRGPRATPHLPFWVHLIKVAPSFASPVRPSSFREKQVEELKEGRPQLVRRQRCHPTSRHQIFIAAKATWVS